jgi:hypothetical protein
MPLNFSLWLKFERPDQVTKFIQLEDSNPFDPVKLGGTVCYPSDFDAANHGNLTAVIGCSTSHIDTNGAGVIISFALGADVTVNAIFGLPMLCDLDSVLSFCTLNRGLPQKLPL